MEVTRSDTSRTSSTSTTMTATEASCDGGELAQSVIWRPEIKLCTPGLGDMLLILEIVKYAVNVFSLLRTPFLVFLLFFTR